MTVDEKLDRALLELAELRTSQALTHQRLDALVSMHAETRDDLAETHSLASDCRGRLDRAEAIVQAGKWLFPSVSAALAAVSGWITYQMGKGGH